MPKVADKIESIKGKNRILLIAPHGFPGDPARDLPEDDKNTGLFARKLANKFGFYAVINEKYSRVEEFENANLKEGLFNCNRIDQVTTYLRDEFLGPILEYKNAIKAKYGNPIIVHVHGVDNENLDEYAKKYKPQKKTSILIGYGQNGQNDKTKTADESLIDSFIQNLSPNGNAGLVAVKVDGESRKYRAEHDNNMNQLFKHKDYKDPSVQSFQLEIKKKHREFRKITSTVDILGNSLLGLLSESMPDIPLVDRAYTSLARIFSTHFENAMVEAGEFIVREFYGDDIERARNKKPTKEKSLNELIIRLRDQNPGTPKKSWIYNAVKLVIQNHDLDGFHTYGKLLLSQKVLLLPMSDVQEKKALVKEIVDKKFTVAQSRERLASAKRKPVSDGITGLIGKPDLLFHPDHSEKIQLTNLRRLNMPELEKIDRRIQNQISNISSEVERLEHKLSSCKGYLGKYNTLSAEVVKAKNQGEAARKSKASKRFKGWEKTTIKLQDGSEIEAEAPIIISTSRVTDLPAFHIDWFMDRLRKGYLVKRKRRSNAKEYISLKKTRLLVFWTKNPAPLFEHLDEIDKMGFRYYFQYTLNDYDKKLEPAIPPLKNRINDFKKLSGRIGKDKVICRFDPLILTNDISREKLLKKVHGVVAQISNHTEKLVFSFLKPDKYNAKNKFKRANIDCQNFSEDDVRYFAGHLGKIGKQYGIEVATCAESIDLEQYGIGSNKCIDDGLIRKVFNDDTELMEFIGDGKGLKDPGQRKSCGCIVSEDIGEYNICSNLCTYCYANASKKVVIENLKRIKRTGEMLLPDKTSPPKKFRNPEMSDSGKNWNVVTGCDKYSDGCLNCYAEGIVDWQIRMNKPVYVDNGFDLTMHEDRLDWPFTLAKKPRRPARSFVTDMGDLFHDKVTDDFIFKVFDTMLKVPQHRFYVLTKRAERLGELGPQLPWRPWIWAGVTVESNRYINRIDHLKGLPAEVNKFLMLEPLLSPMPDLDLNGIHWVVVGGETNKKMRFRPIEEAWVIGIRDQVKAAGLPFMFKHWPGNTHNTNEALLEGRIWAEYPESVVNNMDWDV